MAADRKRVAKRALVREDKKCLPSTPLTKRQRVLADQEKVRKAEAAAKEQARIKALRKEETAERKRKADYDKRYKKEMDRRKRLGHDGPLREFL